MPRGKSEIDSMIPRFELWSQQLFKIASRLRDIDCELADRGIVGRESPPPVSSGDSMGVVRLKEEALALRRERETMRRRMGSVEATVLDGATGEILVPGGPLEGSYLSWMPGERTISWWRAEADTGSPRMLLPETDPDAARPLVH